MGVEGIIRRVHRAIRGSEPETSFDRLHERIEVANVAPVKALGQFGEDKLPPAGHFGHDDTAGVAPVELAFADAQLLGWLSFFGGSRLHLRRDIAPPLAADATILIPGWLPLLIIAAFLDIRLRIILLNPGNHHFRIQRNRLSKGQFRRERDLEQRDRVPQQTLQERVGQGAQYVAEVTGRRKAARHVETVPGSATLLQRKTE